MKQKSGEKRSIFLSRFNHRKSTQSQTKHWEAATKKGFFCF